MEQLSQFVINHWELWLALLVILILILINEVFTQRKKAQSLSPSAAVELINRENAAIVDLRDVEAFQAGHIIHAARVDADNFNLPKVEKYKSKPLILVCARGIQSETLAAKLREQGFERPMVLAGGMAAWLSAGLPTVKGKK